MLTLVVLLKGNFLWFWYIVGIGGGLQLLVEFYGMSSVLILKKRRW